MSLKTLLEAAEFLEWNSKSTTRGGKDQNFHAYAKNSNSHESTDNSLSSDGYEKGQNVDNFKHDWFGAEKRKATAGTGTRIMHNKLEKNRRAHLKECFDNLKDHIPHMDDRKCSNLSILRAAMRHIQHLKRKEKDYEREVEKLAHEKFDHQERIATLRTDLTQLNIDFDINLWMNAQYEDEDTASNSTSTATEAGSPIISEEDRDDMNDQSNRVAISTVSNPPSTIVSRQVMDVLKTSLKPNKDLSHRPSKLLISSLQHRSYTTPASPPVTQLLQKTITQRVALQQKEALKRQLEQRRNSAEGISTSTTQSVSKGSTEMAGTKATSVVAASKPTLVSQLQQRPQGVVIKSPSGISPHVSVLKNVIPTTSATIKIPSSSLTANPFLAKTSGLQTARTSVPHVAVPLVGTSRFTVNLPSNANQTTPSNVTLQKLYSTVTVRQPKSITVSSPNNVPSVITTSKVPLNSGHTVTHVLQAVPSSHIIPTQTGAESQLSAITQLMSRALPTSTLTPIPIMSPMTSNVPQVLTPTVTHLSGATVRPFTVPVSQIINAGSLTSGSQGQVVMSGMPQGVRQIMSPGAIQLSSPILAQTIPTQLFNSQQVLKHPPVQTILQPAFIQQQQLVGQPQLVKPLFMVSMPSVVTIGSTTNPVVASSFSTNPEVISNTVSTVLNPNVTTTTTSNS